MTLATDGHMTTSPFFQVKAFPTFSIDDVGALGAVLSAGSNLNARATTQQDSL